MRIVASNPDGVGDFILRQPAYAAIQAAGHELVLIVRPHSAPIAELVAPGALIFVLDQNAYSFAFDPSSPALQKMFGEIQELRPDLFFIAPQTWTAFEEAFAQALPEIPVLRMNGRLYLKGHAAFEHAPGNETIVAVAARIAEWKKTVQLASVVCGSNGSAAPPRICARESDLAAARSRLQALGACERPFLIACAADTPDNVRGWTAANWAPVLRWAVEHFGVGLVFVGWTREHASTEVIRRMMGDAALRTFNACSSKDDMSVVTGMAALSSGYIGRDTGPMHVAAALGKPVMAVFAGMHWPRFIPMARAGAAVTVKVHCAGCGYRCNLPEHYCISLLTPQAVIGAFRGVSLDAKDGFTVHELNAAALAAPEALAYLEQDEQDRSARHIRFIWPDIIRYAWSDEQFRQRLVDDPRGALAEMGIQLPAGQVVEVIEDSRSKTHMVIPQRIEKKRWTTP